LKVCSHSGSRETGGGAQRAQELVALGAHRDVVAPLEGVAQARKGSTS
jgi:hypothetical protein